MIENAVCQYVVYKTENIILLHTIYSGIVHIGIKIIIIKLDKE